MAITGTFLANFDQFIGAAKGAETSLKNVETGAAKVGTSLDSLKGIATSLAGAFGVGLSVGAVVAFGRELVNTAGALVDLNAKTGVSLDQLQRWAYAGGQAGVSTEAFADASFKLGVKLAGGSGSVQAAVEKLGLSYASLRNQSPDEQFNAIARALEGMEDPQERNRLGVELFGKSFAAIAPAIVKGYSDMAASATTSSAAQLKAIDDASDAWDRFYGRQKTNVTSALGDAVQRFQAFGDLTLVQQAKVVAQSFIGIDAMTGYAKAAADLVDAQTFVGPKQEGATLAAKNYTIELVKAMVEVNHLSKAEIDGIEAAQRLGVSADELTSSFGISEGALKVLTERTKDHAAAQRETAAAAAVFRGALGELTASGDGWKGTLDTIDGAVVEAIKGYLQAGVSQAALATAYGLTATQIKSVASLLRDESDEQRRATEARAEATRITDAATAAEERLNAEKAKAKKHDEELAAAQAKVNAERRAAGGSTQYDLSTAEGRGKVPADVAMLLHDGYSFEQANLLAFAMKMGFDASHDPKLAIKGPRVPGFEAGGSTGRGGLAMTHPGEYVVPKDGVLVSQSSSDRALWDQLNAQQAALWLANGRRVDAQQQAIIDRMAPLTPAGFGGRGGGGTGAGGSITNNFYLVDNSENLARKVADTILRQQLRRGPI